MNGKRLLWRMALGRGLLAAFLVLSFDWVAMPLLILMALVAGIFLLRARRQGMADGARAGRIKALIYGLASLAAVGLFVTRQAEDRKNGDALVAAIEQFKAQRGSYPGRLEELVPGQFKEIPRPHHGPYLYLNEAGSWRLLYVFLPPGGKCAYGSGERAWQCRLD